MAKIIENIQREMTLKGSDVYRKDWTMFYSTPLGSHQWNKPISINILSLRD